MAVSRSSLEVWCIPAKTQAQLSLLTPQTFSIVRLSFFSCSVAMVRLPSQENRGTPPPADLSGRPLFWPHAVVSVSTPGNHHFFAFPFAFWVITREAAPCDPGCKATPTFQSFVFSFAFCAHSDVSHGE